MRKIPVEIFKKFLFDLNLRGQTTLILKTKEDVSIDASQFIKDINPFIIGNGKTITEITEEHRIVQIESPEGLIIIERV